MDEQADFTSRLLFLYHAVSDTQNTIRFLDTKAAFCVTLLTAMMAAVFQFGNAHLVYPRVHLAFQTIFAVLTMVCLSICVRVIFPTVHHQGAFSISGAAEPRFFIVPQPRRRGLLAVLANKRPQGVEMSHAAYTASVMAAADADLVHSMCDEVVTLAFLRQVKSERLHAGIQLLSYTVIAFFVQLAI